MHRAFCRHAYRARKPEACQTRFSPGVVVSDCDKHGAKAAIARPSVESSKEPGFVPSRGRFLARMKFSSPGMLAAKRRADGEDDDLIDPCMRVGRDEGEDSEPEEVVGGVRQQMC